MSASHELESILSAHPFLAGLAPRHVERIVGCATTVSFGANEYLFRAGEKAGDCYLIRQGHVAVEIFDARRGPITIQTVGEPSVLGWSWLVSPYLWCFDARALESTRAIALNAERLHAACEEDHEFGYEMLKRFTKVFAQRLHAARFQLLDVYGQT